MITVIIIFFQILAVVLFINYGCFLHLRYLSGAFAGVITVGFFIFLNLTVKQLKKYRLFCMFFDLNRNGDSIRTVDITSF